MNHNQNDRPIDHSMASYGAGLAVIMFILIGDGFAMTALTMMFDVINQFGAGVFIIGMMVIGLFVSIIPNIIILFTGSIYFVKMNMINCWVQIVISTLWFLTGDHDLILLNMLSFILPVCCLVIIRSEAYQRFVSAYFQLHVLRTEYQRLRKGK